MKIFSLIQTNNGPLQ